MIQRAEVLAIDGKTAVVQVIRAKMCDNCINSEKNRTEKNGTENHGAENHGFEKNDTDTDGCMGCSGCADISGSNDTATARVKNTLGAGVGDIVEVSGNTGCILLCAFALFVFPILLAIAGFYLGELITGNISGSESLSALSYILCGVFFILAYVTVYFLQGRLGKSCSLAITRVISRCGAIDGNDDGVDGNDNNNDENNGD